MSDVQIALLWLAIATSLGFLWGWIARGTLAEYRKYKATIKPEDAA